MPLTGPGLSDLTFAGHVGLIPTAAVAARSNALTGVLSHNPAQKLIEGLATGLATTISSMTFFGVTAGAADPPGNAPAPVPFTVPAAPAAASLFLASTGWVGPTSALFAQSVIQNMLLNTAVLGLMYGGPSTTVGTGSGVFPDPSKTSVISAALEGSLLATLPAALMATGVFGQGDVPGAPINKDLAASIPAYASAYALGLSTLVATVPYVGTAATAAGAAGVVTGGIV
jgi:hypothetical protein